MTKSKRCEWCGSDPVYMKYHDKEWGRIVHDDKKLFEFLILESAQAGLSWITILRRRDNYKNAFADYDVKKVAKFTDADIERLLKDDGIIRNRLKIKSTVSNALYFIKIQNEFGSFCNYINGFFSDGNPIVNYPQTIADIPVTSIQSDAMSKDMKKRGFKFFGSIICYAYLQATGYVNDHIVDCEYKK